MVVGLRERKKARTRAAIRQEALRLFHEQGYAATTVEQIAAAAEVSPSTFFRYFPTKEDVVLHDDYDALLLEAFEAQPADLNPIQALRAAMRAVFSEMSPEELAQERARAALIFVVPELRTRRMDELARTVQMIAAVVAVRVGRRANDLAVRTFAGVVMGVGLSTMLAVAEDPTADYITLMDAGLAYLEAGLPL